MPATMACANRRSALPSSYALTTMALRAAKPSLQDDDDLAALDDAHGGDLRFICRVRGRAVR